MDNINEEWRDIKGFEGLYQVSNLGRVKNAKGLIKKPTMDKRGYFRLSLWEDGKSKGFGVHRLVAEAFVDKVEGKDCINHKNCNKHDNRAENLEWCTYKENSEHAKRNGLMFAGNCKTVRCKQTGNVFKSSYAAAEWLNETKYGNAKQTRSVSGKIRECCLGHQTTAYGYTWEYL